jgi:predicted AAA+ superfamily ATPase
MIIIHAVNNRAYTPRLLETALNRLLKTFPVVVVTGARQTGKSTLVQHVGKDRLYLSLDDVDTLERAQAHPEGIVEQAGRMTLDEVQRSPQLLLAVKRSVDRKRTPGKFILTGSANLLLMKRISESLAGRAAYLSLMPMTRREVLGLQTAGIWDDLFSLPSDQWLKFINDQQAGKEDWKHVASRGGYPEPALQIKRESDRAAWFAGYAKTYLERDLQDFTTVSSLVDFRRLMRAVCLRLGNVINQTELARDVGMSQPTVLRHLNTLEASYQLVRLPAYAVNRTKRLIKSPKAYWTDSGLALHLAGEAEPRGCHLENLVLSDLIAWSGTGNGAQIMYWRTTTGAEVDFIIEWKNALLPVEVKSTTRPRPADAQHLITFRKEYRTSALPGLLLHTGDAVMWLAEGVLAAPWWKII